MLPAFNHFVAMRAVFLVFPLAVAACSSTTSSSTAPDGSISGTGATGGSNANGGSSGSSAGGTLANGGASTGGQSSGSGGAGGGAGDTCGSVSFHLNGGGPAGGSQFCLGPPDCMEGNLLTVLDATGATVTIGLSCGTTDCSGCQGQGCPPGSCHFSSPLPSSGMDLPWGGTQWVSGGTCGTNQACSSRKCAPPGHYVAHMCAYPLPPGSDGGTQICELHASNTPTCVDVPFDYPTAGPVVGVLDPRK